MLPWPIPSLLGGKHLEHVKIEKTKPFAEVEAALDRALPELDPAIRAAIANGDEHQAKEIERGTELYIFLKRDHGELLQITGRARKALQYEIGNPLTATKMTGDPSQPCPCLALKLNIHSLKGSRSPPNRSTVIPPPGKVLKFGAIAANITARAVFLKV